MGIIEAQFSLVLIPIKRNNYSAETPNSHATHKSCEKITDVDRYLRKSFSVWRPKDEGDDAIRYAEEYARTQKPPITELFF